MKTYHFLPLFLFSMGLAQSFGALSQQDLNDDAMVCMSVGLQVSVTGVDDLVLLPLDINGAAGTVYTAHDFFQMESNGPVRIRADGLPLNSFGNEVITAFFIDGQNASLDLPEQQPHFSEHNLTIAAQLGNISSQVAGAYNSVVTVTIEPIIGSQGGCGAFSQTYPYENSQSAYMAFEDLYPYKGDADYNDFVMSFSAQESYNANGELETISMSYEAQARGAGYNHAVLLDLDGSIEKSQNIDFVSMPLFEGNAIIKVTYRNEENGQEHYKYYDKDEDVVIYNSTKAAIAPWANVSEATAGIESRWTTQIDVTLADPSLNLWSDRGELSDDSLRVYLSVINTGYEIDLATINQQDGMVDSNGYPFGIVVPEDWQWPQERINIDDAYPQFSDYRSWLVGETDVLTAEAERWYDSPTTEDGLLYDPN